MNEKIINDTGSAWSNIYIDNYKKKNYYIYPSEFLVLEFAIPAELLLDKFTGLIFYFLYFLSFKRNA